MEGIVTFRADTKTKYKFLTRMEKEEIKEIRHNKMSSNEKFRESSANLLRVILLFGVPVVLSMVMAIVLVAIYIIRPYALTKDFTRTTCEVTGYSIINQTTASCSAGTDPFQPCIKIQVSFPTGTIEGIQNGIIMENEQALVNCNPCSYTFGRHGLLHEYQEPCESWKEYFDPSLCVKNFIEQFGILGSEYPCYFNPYNPSEVIRDLVLDENMLIHAISWPILFCFIYLLSWGFVCYDTKQCHIIDECVKEDLVNKRKRQQMARIHATQLKKHRLGQGLGVRSEIGLSGRNSSYGWVHSRSRQLSTSLPSLCSLNDANGIPERSRFTESTENLELSDNNDNLDLRHLDLAVSQKNINDLTIASRYLDAPLLTYENISASLNTHEEDSQRTLPAMPHSPMSTFRRHTNHHILPTGALCNSEFSAFSTVERYKRITTSSTQIESHSFAQIPVNYGNIFYQEGRTENTNNNAVSVDEIDGYYSITQKRESVQVVDMYSANGDSEV